MKYKYKVEKIDTGTFVIQQHLLVTDYYCYLLVGNQKALLIDTAMRDGAFSDVIKNITGKPIEVLNTHGHVDHIGNNRDFGTVYLNPKDEDVFRLHTDANYLKTELSDALPSIFRAIIRKELAAALQTNPQEKHTPVNDGDTIDLGGRVVEMIETPGHTPGSICVLERGTNRIYSGDTVCDKGVLLHIPGCNTPEHYLVSLEKLKRHTSKLTELWAGHHTHPIDISFIDEYITCVKGIIDATLPSKPLKGGKPDDFQTAYERIGITHHKHH